MNKTIVTIVGLVFAFIFLVYIVGLVPKLLNTTESEKAITTLQARVLQGGLVVSWETERETDGILHYRQGIDSGYERDEGYSKTHKVSSPPLSGEVTYYVESCDIMGQCISSEEMVMTI